ncbi:18813_t:CDS:2 [Entrophospora sp. SA101]|nr:18813_t:CDS:2 [Entrophospora sp. SA101]
MSQAKTDKNQIMEQKLSCLSLHSKDGLALEFLELHHCQEEC